MYNRLQQLVSNQVEIFIKTKIVTASNYMLGLSQKGRNVHVCSFVEIYISLKKENLIQNKDQKHDIYDKLITRFQYISYCLYLPVSQLAPSKPVPAQLQEY